MNLTSAWTAKTVSDNAGLDFSITITRLRVQNASSEVQVQVVFENGEHREQKALLLTMEQYCELQPCKGRISEEDYDRLAHASEFCMALRCGENLLSYGPNSVQTLTRKIMQRGHTREVAACAAEKLSQMGLIDECSDVKREVEKCLRKLWGAKRINAHLWNRGFAADSLSILPELLSEVDFVENCVKLINKHYGGLPESQDELVRMTNGLSRYGYAITEIREAYRALRE